MKRLLILAAVAASLVIVCGAAVFLFQAKPLPSAAAHPVAPSPADRHAAAKAIASDSPPSANPPAAPVATHTPDGKIQGGRKEETPDPRLWNPAEERIQQRIIGELRGAIPEVIPLLTQEASSPKPDEVFAALLHTLDAAQSAPPAKQPPLLLAADLLADKLDFGMKVPPAPEAQQKLDELARYGLVYRWGELGATWVYSHDLLWRVWRDFPASPWAEDAFISLLARDWDSSFDCKGGADSFRVVIREGEDFLARHPQSRYRLETSYLLAQAYETWWSLSRAKACGSQEEADCDEYVDPDSYRQDAEQARQKTISYYEQVLEIAKDGDLAADARRHLDDVKQNLDTVQRRFYCIYD